LQGRDKARRAKNPDEARIKDPASAITATQDKLLTSFEMEKEERMARMTEIQQGQYIIEQGYEILMKKEDNYILAFQDVFLTDNCRKRGFKLSLIISAAFIDPELL
jgi:hypothetical protein